jgi:cyclopropane fatty-acyl-phospholipid synthase-like methyltransferase
VVGARPLTHAERSFDEAFDAAFRILGDTRGKRLLEAGCGGSGWLPYFAQRWGFRVSGIDYSSAGCASAESLARRAGVEAEIVCADFFAPPEQFVGAFDAVVSMGVVEHFADTAAALNALARLLRPGGVLVTEVPNMAGFNGTLQKLLRRSVYDIHVPLDARALAAAHEAAGLRLIECRYLMSFNLGVVNAGRFSFVLAALSRVAWLLERLTGRWPATRALSPYVFAVAELRQ